MATGEPARGEVLSPVVWRPADFTDPGEWTVMLSARERDEIATAARRAASSGLTAATVRREDLPLPGLAARLAEWVTVLSRAGRSC